MSQTICLQESSRERNSYRGSLRNFQRFSKTEIRKASALRSAERIPCDKCIVRRRILEQAALEAAEYPILDDKRRRVLRRPPLSGGSRDVGRRVSRQRRYPQRPQIGHPAACVPTRNLQNIASNWLQGANLSSDEQCIGRHEPPRSSCPFAFVKGNTRAVALG